MTWTDGSQVDYLHDDVHCPVTRYAMYAGGLCFGGYGPNAGDWQAMPAGKTIEGHVCKSSTPCREGWRNFNDACYIYKQSNAYTFEQAEQDCQQDQSHLVSIHDATENDVVAEFLKSQKLCGILWIGIECASGRLTWTDGTAVDYQATPIACGSYSTRFQMYSGQRCGIDLPDSGTWDRTSYLQTNTGYVCKKPYTGDYPKQEVQ